MNRTVDYLRESQNADGGWGYKRGGMSFVEPTAVSILALSIDAESAAHVQRARNYLVSLQHADGGWGIAAMDEESGWMTAWAAWALAGADAAAGARARDWLVQASGVRVTDADQIESIQRILQIDPRVTGWAWQPGDAAWIFPTSLSLLALDALDVRDHPRVQEGIQYLLNRAIPTGGWNIGNPFMVTGSLPPSVECTAIAMMALETFGVKNESTQLAQQYLEREGFTPTAFEWVWRALYAKKIGKSAARAAAALAALQRADGSFDGSVFTTALVALSERESAQ